MPAETAVGVLDRALLSDALFAIHRARFGPQTRVLDGTRGPLAAQLRRAGLALDPGPLGGALNREQALILVNAPGRSDEAAQLLSRIGASDVVICSTTACVPVAAPSPASTGVATNPVPWAGGSEIDPTAAIGG